MGRGPPKDEPGLRVVPALEPVALPEPPAYLSALMRAWWRSVSETYDLGDHDLLRLEATAQAWDRWNQARELIAQSGLTFTDERGIIRAHPAVAIERDARIAFLRGCRELCLEGDAAAPRPPGLRSNRG